MAVPFSSVPTDGLVPFLYVEFDNSQATQGPALLRYRALLIGQKLTAGSAAANSLHRVTSVDQVVALAGRGSMLHRQAIAWFANNRSTETWIGVLADDAAGVKAAGSITVTGPATAAGTISLYLGGERVSVAVAAAATANAIATSIQDAVNANLDLAVEASAVTANVVTMTHFHKGEVGNGFDMRANYQDGEAFPAGVSLAFSPLAAGATNPSLAGLIAAMGDAWYHVIAHPYTDASSLTAIETEMARRFGPTPPIDGVAITSAAGTVSALGTLGDGRNSPHNCIVAQAGTPLTPACEFAAAVAAVVALNANVDPARPLQTLPIAGVRSVPEADRLTDSERDLLLHDGIGTTKIGAGGAVQVERIVTTYKTSSAGSPDTSYRDITTLLTLQYLRYSLRTEFATRYPRHKLASDGSRGSAGQLIMTPALGRATAIAWFRDMQALGLVEISESAAAQLARDLVVERNAQDPNRLDLLVPPDLINQFVTGAFNIQFRL